MRTTDSKAPDAAGLGSAAPPKRVEFAGFDGLRAIAALSVVVTHASFTSGASFDHPAGAFFARMDAGVSIFFLLSGFLLYRPFVAARAEGRKPLALRRYLRRRALRIFPAYWLAFTVVVVVLGHDEIQSAADAVLFYGLLQIYDPDRITHGIGQAWSLATEVSYYAFLPVYAQLMRRLRGGFGVEVAGLVALSAGSLAWKLFVLTERSDVHRLTWLPAYLDLFALGMVLAVVSVWSQRSHRELPIVGALARYGVVSWALAAGCFWVVSTQIGLPRSFEEITVTQAIARHGLYGATALFLVLPAALADKGVVVRFLAWRPMAFLGLISYGIYLWHKAVIEEVLDATGGGLFEADFGELLAWTVAVTIVISTISYFVIEKPALRLKDRSLRGQRLG